MAAVSNLVRSCLTKFTSLVSSTSLSDHAEEISSQSWKDEMGRLRIWSANIGAHQRGQSSLDFRLRDASHIKNQTINLLQGLEDLLDDLKEVLEEDIDDEASQNVETLEDDDRTEIQQIHKDIVDTIHHLYRMSMIIRTPAHHDRLLGTDKLDAQPFKHWAHNHASNKYPLADAGVLECVSSAMALQRAILKYRERHHIKLGQNLDDIKEEDRKSTILSETVATDICHDLPLNNDLLSVADTAETQTSYAGTLIDGTGATKIPSLPKEGANNTPFECPYCFLIISVRDTRAWARHIFRDLMPYVCIFPGCSGRLYESRRQWYSHIENTHADSVRAQRFDCSICKESFSTVMYERHVSRHLEELALFLLPRLSEDEENSEQETDEEAMHLSYEKSSQKSEEPWQDHDEVSIGETSQQHYHEEFMHGFGTEPDLSYLSETAETEDREHEHSLSNIGIIRDPTKESKDGYNLTGTSLERSIGPDYTPMPTNDRLFMRRGIHIYTLRFPKHSIGDGRLTVGAVRSVIAESVGIESQQIIIVFEGKALDDDESTCRAMGLTDGSHFLGISPKDASPNDSSEDSEYEGNGKQRTKKNTSPSDSNLLESSGPEGSEFQRLTELASEERIENMPEQTDNLPKAKSKEKPIQFKDVIGRKFTFPFELCAKWPEVEELIRKCFLHIDYEPVTSNVAKGHYDLIGPDGKVILPQNWETTVQPDSSITMRMWSTIEKQEEGPRPSSSRRLGNPRNPPNIKLITSPLAQVNVLSEWLQQDMLPLVNEYVMNPPTDLKTRRFDYRRLSETILAQVMLKSDGIDPDGDVATRMARKVLIKDAQAALNKLDSVPGLNFSGAPLVEETTKIDFPKKKKHTSPASSHRSFTENDLDHFDHLQDLSEILLPESQDHGNNESTVAPAISERADPSIVPYVAEINILRDNYVALRAKIKGSPKGSKNMTEDCFSLIRAMNREMTRLGEFEYPTRAEDVEAMAHLKELQRMKDHLHVLAGLEIDRSSKRHRHNQRDQ
ncbi:uncharacterized protein N7511_003828 [Penicillium nucicola]|uniref:uncharacterized protein n=1 Tax=Penicillium nucicola TaxID=1850975 RepID=UPI00254580D7|nr:uncharacterized protein N7511_003828 [Penicillium nucicola]KAJ5766212.1 hypothetical protein N7511_003828 [Penicillium nucicola]